MVVRLVVLSATEARDALGGAGSVKSNEPVGVPNLSFLPHANRKQESIRRKPACVWGHGPGAG